VGDLIGLDSLFQKKSRSSPPKKRTVQPGDAFEDTAFNPGFEIVKFKQGSRVSALRFFVKQIPPMAS
jgi:hypothetical protein